MFQYERFGIDSLMVSTVERFYDAVAIFVAVYSVFVQFLEILGTVSKFGDPFSSALPCF